MTTAARFELTCVLARPGLSKLGDPLKQLHVEACCTRRPSLHQFFLYFPFADPLYPIRQTEGLPALLRRTSRCDYTGKIPGCLLRTHLSGYVQSITQIVGCLCLQLHKCFSPSHRHSTLSIAHMQPLRLRLKRFMRTSGSLRLGPKHCLRV